MMTLWGAYVRSSTDHGTACLTAHPDRGGAARAQAQPVAGGCALVTVPCQCSLVTDRVMYWKVDGQREEPR